MSITWVMAGCNKKGQSSGFLNRRWPLLTIPMRVRTSYYV
jgi:hypothetical protein